MKLITIILMLACASCASYEVQANKKRKARVTYYCAREDKRWGSKTAIGSRAIQGITIAAEPSIPFGTRIKIPALSAILGRPIFVVQDRGAAVSRRRASHGRLPVIDVYTKSKAMMKRLARIMPPILDIE